MASRATPARWQLLLYRPTRETDEGFREGGDGIKEDSDSANNQPSGGSRGAPPPVGLLLHFCQRRVGDDHNVMAS